MALDARLFVTTAGCESRTQALELRRRLQQHLGAWYAEKRIAGYEVVVALVEGDYEDYDLDRELIEKATAGALPFVFANVTFDPTGSNLPDLSALERDFRLLPLA
jgi:hypothetical protein